MLVSRSIRPLTRCLAASLPQLRLPRHAGILALAAGLAALPAHAQLSLSGTTYVQDFDDLASGLPLGWTVRTGATASSLGASVSLNTAPNAWGSSTGAFYNFAAGDTTDSGASTGEQAAATDRALGIRQSGTFGDPGGAFTLQLSNTVDLSNFSLSFKAQMLSVQTRSTTWTLQYALGDAPTSFTTIGDSFADPGAFGSSLLTFGSELLSAIANQVQNVWLRIVTLSPSTGGGSRDSFGIDDFTLTYDRAPITADYWDTNDSILGIGGAGIWDTDPEHKLWNPEADGTGTATVYDPNHLAVFGGEAGTVTVNGTVTTNRGLQFDSDGYHLTGGTIVLSGVNSAIDVTNAAYTATISSTISGTVGLNKNGPGTLVLEGENDYSGGTTINDGVLSISSDGNLGATSSGITFGGGTLKTTTSLALAATRALTGTGTIDVASGTTLQIGGSVTGLVLTLSNSGAVLFTGAAPTLSGLTLQKAVSVTTSGAALGIVGNLTAQHPTGNVTFTSDLNFGDVASAIRTVNVTNADATVIFAGNVTISGNTSSRIAKTGPGTLELAGLANSVSGGLRLGEAGLPSIDGGTLRVASSTAFGPSVFQGNAGTLVVLNDMTGANAPAGGLSIGANETNPITITGANIEFKGSSSLFIGGTEQYQNKLVVETNVILSGALAAVSGAVSPIGLTVGGSGSLTLSAATNGYNAPLTIDEATLIMAGNFTNASKPLTTLQNGATLRGSGIMGSVTAIDATIAPGTTAEPIGSFTVDVLDLRNTATLSLDVRSSGALQYDQIIANSTVLIDSAALVGSITLGAEIAVGDLFFIVINGSDAGSLGSFLDLPNDLDQTIFTGPGGSVTFEISYHGDSTTGVFDASGIGGDDIVLRALTAVPEPGSATFLIGSLTGLAGLVRRRQRRVS